MATLKETTKVLIYILCAFIIVLSQVYADVCDDALMDFNMNAEPYMSKRLMAYDDVKNFSLNFGQFKSQIENEGCAAAAIAQTEEARRTVKEKRIETIQKYLKLGIKEEGGKDLATEYDFLTGKNKKYKYDFEDVFSPQTKKTVYENIVVPPKKEEVIKPAKVTSGKCGEVINQNEAVNLENARNQDSVGWCYAYTAADLLSFRLKKRISAVSLYNSGQDIELDIQTRESAQGGDIKQTINAYLEKKNGLCLEEDLPSNDFKFCTNKTYNDFLNNLIASVREKRLDSDLAPGQCLGRDLQAAFPGIDQNFVRNHANRFGTRKLVEALYDNQCKKISFKGFKVSTINNYGNKDSMMKNIDDQLNKGDIIGIGYDYNKINGESGVGGHGSIVVGRRTNPDTGSCEYLVRNSWGKNCEQTESEGLSCHKNCTSDGCRYSGHFWVSDTKLKNSLMGVTYLE